MVKYIFYMLLGLFLVSKAVSASGDIKECKMLHTIGMHYSSEDRHILSEADSRQYKEGTHGDFNCKTGIANIANSFSFRCTSLTKILRNNAAFNTVKIVRCLKIPLPEDKTTSFPFSINPFNNSYRYYIYTLRRILI